MTIDKTKLKSEVESTLAKGAGLLMAIRAEDVRGLLEEIDQLRDSHEQVCTNYNRVSFVAGERGEERDQLKTENEALRKDAERYRWLCDGNGYFLEEIGLCGHGNEKSEADKEIDIAMAEDYQ